jgi:hypothetical protein
MTTAAPCSALVRCAPQTTKIQTQKLPGSSATGAPPPAITSPAGSTPAKRAASGSPSRCPTVTRARNPAHRRRQFVE